MKFYEKLLPFCNDDYKFGLPIELSNATYVEQIETRFNNYLLFLKPLFESFLREDYSTFDFIKHECHVLKEIILSNDDFEVNYSKFSHIFDYVWENYHIETADNIVLNPLCNKTCNNLFRITSVDKKITGCKDITFHVKYDEKSSEAGTYYGYSRYSINDRPSLYLATSIRLCKSEKGNDYKNKNQYISKYRIDYKANYSIRIIEMGFKPKDLIYFFDNKLQKTKRQELINDFFWKDEDNIIKYLVMYPLITTCSCYYTDGRKNNDIYKISKLLSEYSRRNFKRRNCVLAIRYFSCARQNNSEEGFNYMIPTYDSFDNKGHSIELKKIFEFTEPVEFDEQISEIDLFELINKTRFIKL